MATITIKNVPFSMAQATPADAEAVLAILTGAARWLQSRGIQQWGHYLDGSGAAELPGAIAAGEVWLVKQGDRPAGTISLQGAPSDWDRTIWGAGAGEAAMYVHRLAVDRAFAGTGLGERLLEWAEERARAAGKRCLRLDCVGHNEALNAYYAGRYAFRGQAENIGMRFSKYEQSLV